ncbi:energy-coupling factor ABC transporter permease [Labilibacter sediminis]|nr:energy-coupling factor ABC transporter permease [Labilibacter sediminis]
MLKKLLIVLVLLLYPVLGYGMHIAEGFLPVKWVLIWWLVYLPFLFFGVKHLKQILEECSAAKLLFAVAGAFVFVLSSLKLPSVAGSSSHLTGIALGAILFGASSMSIIGFIALLFQAILLAHGGITTLGANAFSMSVAGAFTAVWVYKGFKIMALPQWLSVFVAAFCSDLVIYICTSAQLALAFQSAQSTLLESMLKFLSVFAVTQLPLALLEGIFTVFAFRLIQKYSWSDIISINPSLK